MKFIVSSSTLYKELQTLGGVINSTNTIPILDNFLFEVDNNNLKISSSDLESTMTSEMVVKSIQWYSHRSRSTMNTSPRVWNSTHVIE